MLLLNCLLSCISKVTGVVFIPYRVPPSGKRVVPVARQKWKR